MIKKQNNPEKRKPMRGRKNPEWKKQREIQRGKKRKREERKNIICI
jgi:hypothetical protein